MASAEGGEQEVKLPSQHELCESYVDYVLQNINTVQYLFKSINELRPESLPLTRSSIKCVPFSQHPAAQSPRASKAAQDDGEDVQPRMQAGYVWRTLSQDVHKGDVVLKEEDMKTAVLVERNLRHELIHAYDDVRGVIEPTNCMHHACSEIRAARLSGDCLVGQEMKRGRFDFFQSGMKCVRRRAVMAVENNPMCRDFGERSVDRVFQRCYEDYEPYAAPIFSMGSHGTEKYDV